MNSASDALQRLRNGNDRFVNGKSTVESSSYSKRPDVSGGQSPFAIVLACSDSRVPVEQLFDQSIGDLFVIRVAGNVAAPTQIGSIEYAATQLGTGLIVVLGHSGCGAVAATLGEMAGDADIRSPNLRAIVDRIRPAVDSVDGNDLEGAVRANVQNSVARLSYGSSTLEQLIGDGTVAVVGASYSLETGIVDFLDDAQ